MSESLSRDIRAALADAHAAIERVPLARALIAGTVTREQYARLLGQLLACHETLEGELARHAELAPVFPPGSGRVGVILGDLEALRLAVVPPDAPARQLCDTFRSWSHSQPMSLAGALYVFEGSRMGSMMLAKSIAAALGVPCELGRGVDYHLQDAAERPRLWAEFKAAFDRLAPGEPIVSAATVTMNALHAIYEAIVPA